MTTEKAAATGSSFATTRLPKLVGAAGLLVYLLTLNHWVSLLSLPTVARISGWLWRPELGRPLTLTVLFPFRILPESWIPLAINVFTAICAAATLALLARSVALLRYDVSPDDPFRKKQPPSILSTPTAWIPPLLAALVCGLQLSFWENATSATGEMINALVLAYVIRCLLEFRMDRKQSWLSRAALLFAAGMANNWVTVAYFPVFIAAIIWIKGFSDFLDRRFLLRMALCGLAGLSLYLLLPALQSLSSAQPAIWPALKASLKSQKHSLEMLRIPPTHLLVATSLLPFLVLSIRWKSHTVQLADDNRFGVFFIKATGHFVHALFFVTALWISLNPTFSPRHLDLGSPMLIYYYVWAMVAGYCAGYFLLFGSRGGHRWLAKLPVVATFALLCVFPVVLAWRNLGQIRVTNGPSVREFARQLYEDLPPGKSVVLSEDSRQLLLLRAELSARGHEKDALLLETPSLVSPQYHGVMAGKFKSRWPVSPPTNKVDAVGPNQLLGLVSAFAAREPVVYLHPSSGLFFEAFTDEPNGTIHRLVQSSATNAAGLLHADRVIAANGQIWQQRWEKHLRKLAAQTETPPRRASERSGSPLSRFRLAQEQNVTASVLGAAYSKSLDYWGVELQRLGRWPEAGVWFGRAVALNPDSLAAHINAEFNARRQRGDKARLTVETPKREFPELFSKYENWWEVLNENGPVDEPTFLLLTGRIFLNSRNDRQAMRSVERSVELAPDWLPPKLALAQCCNHLGDFAGALEMTDRIQASGETLNGLGMAQLLYSRATALRGLGRTNDAAACIATFTKEHGEHREVLSTTAYLYAESGQFETALEALRRLIEREPENAELLVRKGSAELRLGRYDAAIATLTAALTLTPSSGDARLLRAVACLGAGQLEAARADYKVLLDTPGNSQNALFGLGGIAWRERDTNAVIQYYQQYLSNSMAMSPQQRVVLGRLKQLKDD